VPAGRGAIFRAARALPRMHPQKVSFRCAPARYRRDSACVTTQERQLLARLKRAPTRRTRAGSRRCRRLRSKGRAVPDRPERLATPWRDCPSWRAGQAPAPRPSPARRGRRGQALQDQGLLAARHASDRDVATQLEVYSCIAMRWCATEELQPSIDGCAPGKIPHSPCTRRSQMTDRDLTRTYSRGQFAAKLRRLADSIEAAEPFTIQVAGERLRVPANVTSTSSTSAWVRKRRSSSS
jgi:hypothetical protein